VVIGLAAAAAAGCGGPCPSCPASPLPGAASAPVSAASAKAAERTPVPTSNEDRQGIAVLPLDDDELFRAERAELRKLLASELTRKLPSYEVVPLVDVDAKLVPHPTAGARCAHERESSERRAHDNGWFTTGFVHVLGAPDQPEELWVEISSAEQSREVLGATWDPKLPRLERYRVALRAMVSRPDLVGGLGLSGTASREDTVTTGALTLCEERDYERCAPETKTFTDRAAAFQRCFSDADETSGVLLFDAERCELAGLDDAAGSDGRREQCLCAALTDSAGRAAKPGRRSLSLHFEALALKGKLRPELRILEASPNLDARLDYRTVRVVRDGKERANTIRRFTVPGLDDARPPLARCPVKPGVTVVAELRPSEAGLASNPRVVSGSPSPASTRCIEDALKRVAWPCTDDHKDGTLRVALSWPE
jgi:hypothetical protein